MKSRSGTTFIVVVAVGYLALVRAIAFSLEQTAGTLGLVVGVSVMVLPVIAAYLVWRELAFGNGAHEMGAVLDAQSVESTGGRTHAVESNGLGGHDDWVAWFRTAVAHEGHGDRRQARAAMRRAWRLYRGRRVWS